MQSTKSARLVKHLALIPNLDCVKRTLRAFTAVDAVNARGIIASIMQSAGLSVDAVRQVIDRIAADTSHYVIVRPDSPLTLHELNAAQSDCVYRAHSGYGDGRLLKLEVYARDFRAAGFGELADALTLENVRAMRAEFNARTVSLRDALYSASGKPDYIRRCVAELGTAVVKLTVADDALVFPSGTESRTTGNAYALIVENVGDASHAVTARIAAKAEETARKNAERDAARKQAADKQAAQAVTVTTDAASDKSKSERKRARKQAKQAK